VIYNLRHRTIYTYGTAVKFARCMLRLTPTSSRTQTVLQTSVTVTPTPSRIIERIGPFGEPTLSIVVDEPHRLLKIEARSRIDVHAGSDALTFNVPWETIRARAFDASSIEPASPASHLYPTGRTPVLPAITSYARQSFGQGRPIIEATRELMTRIYDDFTYDSEATDVSTPASEAFETRHGVCQDFAHIMISGLRGLGLPAAYVSGYLRTLPPTGGVRLEGADATHAWVTVWCGEEEGWIGFDPTNAILARNDHIVLAVGRDYSDVAPIDGIILAPGKQKLKVGVDVVPESEPVGTG
jgi:transglutaminase-like putative cysteine protease